VRYTMLFSEPSTQPETLAALDWPQSVPDAEILQVSMSLQFSVDRRDALVWLP
jgi:hypothetical protein